MKDEPEPHAIETIAQLSNKQRAEVFSETAAQLGLPEAAIEKDFWVCWALQKIFNDPVLSQQVLFKGGTTLSKCYNLIERFSEDLDLILDWELITDDDPYAKRSNTKQDLFNKSIKSKTESYINNIMLDQIDKLVNTHCRLKINNDKLGSIMMSYPKAFDSEYIKPQIELEVGAMSAMIPKTKITIAPYCASVTQSIAGNLDLTVNVIQAKKTFWDKVTILHVEAYRPEPKTQPARYSRHYYDLYQMLNSAVKKEAMSDLKLLNDIVDFKARFYPQGWAKYDLAKLGEYKLIPERFRVKQLKKDYTQMKEMIFGKYPLFDDILSEIKQFESELRAAHNQSK